MRIAAAVLVLALFARAADEEKDLVTLQVSEEMELSTFLDMISQTTGIPVLYDRNGQRIRNQKIGVNITTKVPKSKLLQAYRAMLAFYELTLIPIGPKGYESYIAIDSRSTNNFIKNKAMRVEAKDLPRMADQDGFFISAFIPVENIANLTTLRTALSTMVTPAGIGRVHEVPGAGLILMDFAPTVAAMYELIQEMDRKGPNTEVLESIELTYANAKEVAASVQDLYGDAPVATPQAAQRGSSARVPGPRLVPFPSRNAVLVRATARDLETIRGLIAKLDEQRGQRGATTIIALKHVEANYLADVLTVMLKGPATSDWEIAIVAEMHTNSLLVNGDRNAIVAVGEIVKQIDREKSK